MEGKLQSYNKFELNKNIKLIGCKILESENISDHFLDDISWIVDPDDKNSKKSQKRNSANPEPSLWNL